jgi:hypothetical protein
MLHCVVSKELTDVSEVLNAFIIITLVMQAVSTSEMSVVKYSKDKMSTGLWNISSQVAVFYTCV